MKIALLAGGLVGVLLATWITPTLIAWWFEPPVEVGCSCQEPILWAMSTFRRTQLVGLVSGAIAGFVAWALFRRSTSPTYRT